MTAAALRKPRPTPTAVEVFHERCEAHAILVEACLLDLREAVDVLQADAERTGLINDIGQDAVQAMMAAAFAIVLRDVANFATLKPEPTRDVGNLPIPKPRSGSATSTLWAAEYLVGQNDPARLRAFLAKHTCAECTAILHHIERIRP